MAHAVGPITSASLKQAILVLVISAGWLLPTTSCFAIDSAVDFNRDIRPIFANSCWQCHGPGTREAGFRLDRRDEALSAADSGAIPLVPGEPSQSEVIRRIMSTDESEQMPPPDANKPLTAEQQDLLRQWVLEGAVYQGHWSLEPLDRPTVPDLPNPSGPLRNPIDHFVQRRLEREELAPSPEADRRTLLRRVTLDLSGLPPSPDEVSEFLQDDSADAYEKVVARLLASPRFAEKQTVYWLDAVRYADTVGFHGDQNLSLWPYRDYVLNAIDQNMPFDQFTQEQLAGDLIPGSNRIQRVASAFNRLNRMSTEGGVQDKEYRAKYAADRVRTVSQVWLGMTLGCAECHDHKFDPFTAHDFYSMAAFFSDIEEQGFYDRGFSHAEWGPQISLPTSEQERRLSLVEHELSDVRKTIDAITDDELEAERKVWETDVRRLAEADQLKWQYQHPTSAETQNGATLSIKETGLVVAGGPNPDRETYTITFQPGEGRWTSLLLQTGVADELKGNRFGRGWVSYVVTDLSLSVSGVDDEIAFTEAISDGRGETSRFPAWGAIDDDDATGWGFEIWHSFTHQLLVRFQTPLETSEESVVTLQLSQQSEIRRATIGRFRIALSHVPGATLDEAGLPPTVIEAIQTAPELATPEQDGVLKDHFRIASPRLTPWRQEAAELSGARSLLLGQIPTVLITEATSRLRQVRVLPRGNWMDDSGQIVQPAIPQAFGALSDEGFRLTRLDLAKWIVSRDNPLAARAFVNRQWRQFLGQGLSATLGDLGSQGEPPSHPELLDWLAAEFIEPSWDSLGTHAWDWKHLVRVIVTSHTYRQSSLPRDDLAATDPENRLLARQNSFRLDAEFVRDNALAISGLLHNRLGGPSVFPFQPDGYWSPLNYPQREYAASYGADLHRRSVYTHWQRTFLHPTMLAFDACTREESSVDRSNSNTPQQALILLNDPIYHETAREFAVLINDQGDSDESKIQWAFERALSRKPLAAESEVLRRQLTERREFFETNRNAALDFVRLAGQPSPETESLIELAAMTAVARTLLNLHETITRN